MNEKINGTEGYIAIRHDNFDNKLWYDWGTCASYPEGARAKAHETDLAIPHYAKDNPVIKIVPVELVPIKHNK